MKNKTALITGASGGIGSEIAKVFAKNGYRLILNYYKSKKEAEGLEKDLLNLGYDALAIKADVSDFLETEDMVKKALKFLGKIDVLVNSAGVCLQKLLHKTESKEWDYVFDVNVKGVFNCCKAVLPTMIHERSGKIINISSIFGLKGASLEVAYSASKAAIVGFTKALAKEVGPSSINVNCVVPGVINTKMNKNLSNGDMEVLRNSSSLLKIGLPRDVANAVLFLASKEANFITGQTIIVDGGLIA